VPVGGQHPQDDRQREAHPQGQQGDRVDGRGGVGQLDEDRLQREAGGGQHRQGDAEALGGQVLPRHDGPPVGEFAMGE
jgi:hypothetical protein